MTACVAPESTRSADFTTSAADHIKRAKRLGQYLVSWELPEGAEHGIYDVEGPVRAGIVNIIPLLN